MGLDSFVRISFHFERQRSHWQESPQDSAFNLEAIIKTLLPSK